MDVWSIEWMGWIELGIYLIEIVHGETLCSDNIDVGSPSITVSNHMQFNPILERAKKPGVRISVSSYLKIIWRSVLVN